MRRCGARAAVALAAGSSGVATASEEALGLLEHPPELSAGLVCIIRSGT
jgi:hypothetical protein